MTIHDSIVTFPEHAGAVTMILEESFGSADVRSTIKVTPFDEEAQEVRRSGLDEKLDWRRHVG